MKMKIIYRIHYGWGKFVHLTAAAVIVLVSNYAPATLAAVPTIFMQSATINGASDALALTRIPVQDAAGKITYKNIIMAFDVDDQGKLSLRPSSFKITTSPTLLVGQFKQGVYQGSVHASYYPYEVVLYDVGSPGVLTGGRTAGSIHSRPVSGAHEFNAAWVCGSIKGHPNEAALKAAGITSSSLCWGSVQVTNNDSRIDTYPGWKSGDIIGAVQTGNSLSIYNFGDDNVENAALVFTLCPTCQ